jgi:hypothetical protein
MFERLAKSGLVKFWPVQPPRPAPRLHEAAHSNDNLPGFRRPKGLRRIPSPSLACHWIDCNGRLEGRWEVDGDAPSAGFDEPPRSAPGHACAGSPLRSRNLALAR